MGTAIPAPLQKASCNVSAQHKGREALALICSTCHFVLCGACWSTLADEGNACSSAPESE
eukprot:8813868-Prorocentrum_lima.AAC.1